ncbi:MAG: CPBP family glutamic-type intramembrane protease [Pseudohongiellaceae bacterium]
MAICPAIVGAFLAWRTHGTSAVRAFFRSAVHFVDMRLWVWLVAVGTMPLVMFVSGVILFGLGESLPAPEIRFGQTVVLFALFFLAATAEELGWTGYVTLPLVQKQGMIVAGLVIGGVAAIWHVIPLLQVERSYSWIAWWTIGTVCRRILIVWLYVKGGQRVFAASLFHAMGNVSWMLFPVMGSHYDPVSTAIILLVPVLLVASISGNTRNIG